MHTYKHKLSIITKTVFSFFCVCIISCAYAQKTAIDFFNFGYSQVEQQNYVKAIEFYNKAIELDSTMVNAYYNRAIANIYLEKLPESLVDLNKAVEMKPDFAVALYKRGLVKYNLHKREDGCHDIDNARSLGWEDAETTYKEYCW